MILGDMRDDAPFAGPPEPLALGGGARELDEPAGRLAIVVEDNLMVSASIQAALAVAGWESRARPATEACLRELVRERPALLLVNLASVRYPGAPFIRSARASPELAGLPILAYCGHVEVELIRAGREAGADRVAANSAVLRDLASLLRGMGL